MIFGIIIIKGVNNALKGVKFQRCLTPHAFRVRFCNSPISNVKTGQNPHLALKLAQVLKQKQPYVS